MIQARNRSSHTNNEKDGHEVAAAILASFVPEFAAFRVRFAEIEVLEP